MCNLSDKKTKTLVKNEIQYDKVKCPRCNGSGRYSFNRRDGFKCLGCNGQGVKLTKEAALVKKTYKQFKARNGGRIKFSQSQELESIISGMAGAKIIKEYEYK